MTVGRCDPAYIRRMGLARFARAVTRELPRWGGRRRHLRILRALYAAAGDDRGVQAQRAGALERSALVLADFKQALAALAEVEARMAKVLAELGLAELVTSIRGVSVVGAAAILAETGDPPASTTPRRWSSTPACAHGTTPRAPLPPRPPSRVGVGHCCGWPPGGRCGARCRTTRCSPPATPT
jgi:transposase